MSVEHCPHCAMPTLDHATFEEAPAGTWYIRRACTTCGNITDRWHFNDAQNLLLSTYGPDVVKSPIWPWQPPVHTKPEPRP